MELYEELKEEYLALSRRYKDTRCGDVLNELRFVKSMMVDLRMMEKVDVGSTMSIMQAAKDMKVQHKEAGNLDKEELELIAARQELFAKTYTYRSGEDVLEGVINGEETPKRGKELIELYNLISNDEIMKKLEELERKML